MLPALFSIGPLTFYTYGIFLFIAFFLGTFVLWKRGRESHFDEEQLLETMFYTIFFGLLGARIGYILTHAPSFGWNVWLWLNVLGKPGFEEFGLMLAGSLAFYRKAKKMKWDVFAGADVIVAGYALWKAIMALANFFNGSGYGMATTSFIGVSFQGLYEKRVPVQLLEMVLYGFLFAFLWKVESHYRTFYWYKGTKSEANSGFLGASYLTFAGIITWFMTLLRPTHLFLPSIFPIRIEFLWGLVLLVAGLSLFHFRSGWGLLGILKVWFRDWGVTGSLVENWKRRRNGGESFDRLKLGRDIFE